MWFWKKQLFVRKKLLQSNTKKQIKLKKTPRWYRTEDVQGHAPKFNIRCIHCDMPLSLRHSVIVDPKWNAATDDDNDLNVMSYKCPRCAWFIRFYVLDERRYLKKVIRKYRKGYRKFIPKGDDWSEEQEEIGRQLKALNYWGGR